MKRLIASVAVFALCLSVSGMYFFADPGSATTSDESTIIIDESYPPPPDGYEGVWPPDWMTTTTTLDGDDPSDTGTTDTTGSGGDPWGNPIP